jgi:Protein of unknown function (DUF2852)
MEIAAKLDEWGKGAWIAAMIAGFVVFWPAGLAILAYMIWSGRMGCMHHHWNDDMRNEMRAKREEMRNEWRARRDEWHQMRRAWRDEMRGRWKQGHSAMRPSGNAAFDDYKSETLRRLEEEQAEFSEFLDNLRKARDKAEFDQFMQSRRDATSSEPGKEGDGPTASA